MKDRWREGVCKLVCLPVVDNLIWARRALEGHAFPGISKETNRRTENLYLLFTSSHFLIKIIK